MSSPIEHLSRLPPLASVPAPAIAATARYWLLRDLAPGERWRSQGEAADGLGLILSGGMVASADGVELARLGPGELVGEVSAFLANSRALATLVATGPVSLFTLSSRSLLGLRRQDSPVYDALLNAALQALSARVRQTDGQIADLCGPLSATEGDWDSGAPTPSASELPPLGPLLASLPGLSVASAEVLDALVHAFEPVPMRRGETLTTEGQPGESAWVVARGCVQVRRDRGGSVELARLGPGDPFGFNALIDDGLRSASCVALSEGWLWRMSRERYQTLSRPALRAWRETLLATLATQLRIANSCISMPNSAREANFRTLLSAAGALEGLSGGEAVALEHPLAEADPLRGPR